MDLTLALAFSYHIGLKGEHNELHPSIRFKHDHFIAGAYLNSENGVSPFVGLRFEYKGFFAEGGAVSGYSGADVAPFGRIGYEFSDSAGFFAAPAYELPNRLGMVIGVEFEF